MKRNIVMKKNLLSALVVLGVSLPIVAFARHDTNGIIWGVPQQTVQPTMQESTRNVMHRVFAETEKAVMEEYFGQTSNNQTADKVVVVERYYHHDEDEEDEDEDEGHGHNKHHKKHKKHKSHGHDDHKGLPPGLAMQLKRNGHLPYGLEKRRLPAGLASRLPQCTRGTERYIVGSDVVLLDTKTQLILDVIKGVVGQ
jgi:hypothetical protein